MQSISIIRHCREAWVKVKGAKKNVSIPALISIMITVLVCVGQLIYEAHDPKHASLIHQLVVFLIFSFVAFPFWAVSQYAALLRVRDQKPTLRFIFSRLDRGFALGVSMLIQGFLMAVVCFLVLFIGMLLAKTHLLQVLLMLLMISVVLAMAINTLFCLSTLYILDQNLNPIAALIQSAKSIKGHFRKAYVLVILATCIGPLGFQVFVLPAFWTLPWAALIIANLYVKLSVSDC